MRSFAARSTEEEMMDGETVTAADFAACLHDLAQVNSVTLARPPTLSFLARATKTLRKGEAFSLIDVGYGEGDMLRAVHRWATRRGLRPRLGGVDLNPRSEPAARAATDPALGIDYRTGDVFDLGDHEAPDFVISSLVTHHMSNAQVVRFVRWMEAVTQRGWLVNDLHRNAFAFYGFKLLSTLAAWHPFVRHDGPVSVARAFRRADWERLLAEAGAPAADIRWRFPFRYCVERIK